MAQVIALMTHPRRSRGALVAALSLGAALAIAACGGGTEGGEPQGDGSGPPAAEEIEGLPKPLEQNRAEANQLIDGAAEALEAKREELSGFPLVVNQWGSWCPPCRAEFPFFAELADEHAEEVAFLGIDLEDDRGAAEEFLAEFPVPYPSIFDPDGDAVDSLDWAGFSPTTWFIDEQGEVVFVRNGTYPDQGTLNADIHNHLLDGSG